MENTRGLPSDWLLKNSKGFPDFLFTILTYSMILLAFVALVWIAFGILSFIHAGTPKAATLIQVMESMKTGLISLAGVVFGLAGSYTVRRYKHDDHYLQKKAIDHEAARQTTKGVAMEKGLKIVMDKEDI